VLQFSSIIGCYLFAMGSARTFQICGRPRRAGPLHRHRAAGGAARRLSATLLFLLFAWMSAPFRSALYALVFVLGVLVGMEIPLVMRVLNARQASFSELVSRVLTFDYLGAGGVAAVPAGAGAQAGLSRTGFLFGMANVAVALWTLWHYRAEIPACGPPPARRAGDGLPGRRAGRLRPAHPLGRAGLFGDEVIFATTTPYQRLVVTRWKDDTRLYINGNLQFSSRDEHRYHEALVHPALQSLPWALGLVLGGGDGLAVREILRHANIQQVTLVDLDPAMTDLFSRNTELAALNAGALSDPRVTVINADAGQWLETNAEVFDLIIADFPDPPASASASSTRCRSTG
jgi:spermidine synthase